MICRVTIPTVLRPNERETVPQARLHVSFDDRGFEQGFYVLPAQAATTADWLEAADLAWDSEPAGTLAAALRSAVASLQEKPPRLVPERFIGLVRGEDSEGLTAFLEVAVETGVMEASNPRIVLRSGESMEEPNDTWWLLDREAQHLQQLVKARTTGALTEAGPNQRPFLHVTPLDEAGLLLRFDDDVLDERGEDGELRLAAAAANKLAELLAQAVALSEEQPPYVFVPPEPRDVVVAELHW
jgi:hypothetical protein